MGTLYLIGMLLIFIVNMMVLLLMLAPKIHAILSKTEQLPPPLNSHQSSTNISVGSISNLNNNVNNNNDDDDDGLKIVKNQRFMLRFKSERGINNGEENKSESQ